jgi:transposase InsO family protein
MKLHANAALGPKGREVMVRRVIEAGWSVTEAAAVAGVSDQTCRKWLGRFVADGPAGLIDRSSVPTSVPSRTPEDRVQVIAALRRLRFTGAQIAEVLGMPETTVSGILTRIGMGRLGRLGQEPAVRYERRRAGELIHVDVKKLGRIQGGAGHRVTGKRRYNPTTIKLGIRRGLVRWEFVHIAIDDATRLAYAEVLSDETAATAVAFLRRARRFLATYGVTIKALLTDNGSAYRSAIHAIACKALGIRHLRTRPRRPQTNGKAERFIRTMLAEWAYGAIYGSSAERTRALEGWLLRYNHHRNHSALGRKPPAARLTELLHNNPLGTYT